MLLKKLSMQGVLDLDFGQERAIDSAFEQRSGLWKIQPVDKLPDALVVGLKRRQLLFSDVRERLQPFCEPHTDLRFRWA